MSEPYVDIHHFEPNNQSGMVDDDGDDLLGWYFQIMASAEEAITDIIGPYRFREMAEDAARTEWAEITA